MRIEIDLTEEEYQAIMDPMRIMEERLGFISTDHERAARKLCDAHARAKYELHHLEAATTIRAHSKSEFKRLSAMGADVVAPSPPIDTILEEARNKANWAAVTPCKKHKQWPCRICGTVHFDGCECSLCTIDTPRTNAITANVKRRTLKEARYWCEEYRVLCCHLERELTWRLRNEWKPVSSKPEVSYVTADPKHTHVLLLDYDLKYWLCRLPPAPNQKNTENK
jgi:hypothetical protein